MTQQVFTNFNHDDCLEVYSLVYHWVDQNDLCSCLILYSKSGVSILNNENKIILNDLK